MSENNQIQVAEQITPMAIIQSAVAGNIDVSQLEKLMELQERWEAREAKKAFDKALALFKSEPIKISKDKHVRYKTSKGNVNYKHATLGNIIDVINPALSKHGLSISWRTAIESNFIKVTAILAHENGHYESTYLAATADSTGNKNALQAVGSTISYLQRYTALSITGLTTDELDDDGATGATVNPQGNPVYHEMPPVQQMGNKTNTGIGNTEYLDQIISYIDGFCDKSLDEFIEMKDAKLTKETYAKLPNDKQRQKLKSHVNSVEQLLLEKQGVK